MTVNSIVLVSQCPMTLIIQDRTSMELVLKFSVVNVDFLMT